MGQEESQGRRQAIGRYVWAAAIAVADVQEREIAEEKIHNTGWRSWLSQMRRMRRTLPTREIR